MEGLKADGQAEQYYCITLRGATVEGLKADGQRLHTVIYSPKYLALTSVGNWMDVWER